MTHNSFILDSGATQTTSYIHQQLFTVYNKLIQPQYSSVGNGAKLKLIGKGTLAIPNTTITLEYALRPRHYKQFGIRATTHKKRLHYFVQFNQFLHQYTG